MLSLLTVGALLAIIFRYTSDAHTAAVSSLAVLCVAFAGGMIVLVPWQRWPIPRFDEWEALASLPQEHVRRAKALRRAKLPMGIVGLIISLALTFAMGLTPLGASFIRELGDLVGGGRAMRVAVGAAGLVAINLLLSLPLQVQLQRVMRRFGLSKQGWGAWVFDQIKGFVLGSIFLALILTALYGAINFSPEWWWLWATGFLVALSLGINLIFPVWILPLFMKSKPLESGQLRDRLFALAREAEVKLGEVYVTDPKGRTTGHNAAVAGFGPTRRMLLFKTLFESKNDNSASGVTQPALERDEMLDPGLRVIADSPAEEKVTLNNTLLRGASDDEIATIFGHELAHAKYQDALRGLFMGTVQSAIMMCALFLMSDWQWLLDRTGIGTFTDPESIVLFFAFSSVFSLVTAPLGSIMSRRAEARADLYALQLTNNPDAFESGWRGIMTTNLADPTPNRILYTLLASHPTVPKRLAMARWYRRLMNVRAGVR